MEVNVEETTYIYVFMHLFEEDLIEDLTNMYPLQKGKEQILDLADLFLLFSLVGQIYTVLPCHDCIIISNTVHFLF